MATRKFSVFTNGGTSQTPSCYLVGIDPSLAASAQNSRWTLNNLFSYPASRNVTDESMRWETAIAPALSAAGEASLYYNGTALQVSYNGGAYSALGSSGGITGGVNGYLLKATAATTATDSGIVSTQAANSVSSRKNVLDYADFATALSSIGSSTLTTLVIPTSTTVSATATVTANITLEFTNTGQLSVAAGQTLTIKGPVNALLRQIFTGAGTTTFTANRRIAAFYPEWWGGIPDGSTNSTAACNAAITAAISINGNGGGKTIFNGGVWLANLSIVTARGLSFIGVGREGTFIKNVGDSPVVQANGLWYSYFEGISFQAASTITTSALFELDGNYDGIHTQGVQGNTFKDCTFHAVGFANYGLAIVRQGGGGAQGSENLFLNCHWKSTLIAGLYIVGANALQNTVVGGNFQTCIQGARISAGSANFYSVGFQNQGSSARAAIESGQWDVIILNSVDDHIEIRDCRSESPRFVSTANFAAVDLSNNTLISGIQPWAASQVYAQGATVIGVTGAGGTGRMYVAIIGGTSGGTEPVWPAVDIINDNTGSAMTNGSPLLTISGSAAASLGMGAIVDGAGVAGATLYATVTGTGAPLTLSASASTTVSGAQVRIGAVMVDGSVTWMEYDYNEVSLRGGAAITNNTFKWGRLDIGQSANVDERYGILVENNSFARTDWLSGFAGNYPQARLTIANNTVNLNGGANSGGVATAYPVSVVNGGPTPPTYKSPLAVGGQTLVWVGGATRTNQTDISLTPDFTNTRLTCSADLRGTSKTLAGNPTTAEIAAGTWAVYKNTSSGAVALWTNDGGVMKSVVLT